MKTEIFKMYEDICIGKNDICLKCNHSGLMQKPLSYYYGGDKFQKGADTVLFVGKTAVGGAAFESEYLGDFKSDLFTDSTKFGEKSLDLIERWATSRPFYHYTHDITKKYYGTYEEGKKYIGLTNIVKCNNTSTNDTTNNRIKAHCINELGVIWKEIEILSPKRVVFFTNTFYDRFIDLYVPKNCSKEDIKNNRLKIGNKSTPWWHRRFLDEDNKTVFEFLRLGHPQMMYKPDYVNEVVKWLQETK